MKPLVRLARHIALDGREDRALRLMARTEGYGELEIDRAVVFGHHLHEAATAGHGRDWLEAMLQTRFGPGPRSAVAKCAEFIQDQAGFISNEKRLEAARRFRASMPELAAEVDAAVGSWPSSEPELRAFQAVR